MTTEPRRFARTQRRNQTSAEDALWQQLRGPRLAGTKWRRQVTFGPYTVDFLCLAAKLIVEVDGRQHANVPTLRRHAQPRDRGPGLHRVQASGQPCS